MNPSPESDRDQPARRYANRIILGAFVLLVLVDRVKWARVQLFKKGIPVYIYTDWLVDYSAGFVRRGLSGECLRLLSPYVTPMTAIAVLTMGIFAGLIAAYVRLVSRSLDRLNPALLACVLFLPSQFPFYLNDTSTCLRKEVAGILILAWHLYVLEACKGKGPSGYLRRLLPITLLVLPIHVLVHEASFFLFVPCHLLLSETVLRLDPALGLRRRLRWLALAYLPVTATFLIVLRYGRVTTAMADAISRNWAAIGALPAIDPSRHVRGALRHIDSSFSQAFEMTTRTSATAVVEWIVLLGVLGVLTAYAGVMVTNALGAERATAGFDPRAFGQPLCRRVLAKYFVLPLLCTVPLYLVGCDFGRWFAVTCISYLLVALSPEVVGAEQSATTARAGSSPVRPPDARTALSPGYRCQVAVFLLAAFFLRLPPLSVSTEGFFGGPILSLMKISTHAHARPPRAVGK